MKQSTNFLTIILALLIIAFPTVQTLAQTQEESKAIGNWVGKIQTPISKIEMIFKVKLSDQDKLVSTLDVPIQGVKDDLVNKTIATDDSLILIIEKVNGSFKGKYTNETTLEGKWSQGMMSSPMTLTKKEKISEPKRPQTPKPPFAYNIEEVEYKNETDGTTLTGTLTYPRKKGKHPAVILVTGTGPQDRDQTIMKHKPFWVIADYLTKNGIAVLRVDDRGVGGSGGNINLATNKVLSSDVITGLNFLKTRKHIETNKLGIIGHSEGGIVAPIVATKMDDLAFIVMMAGPGVDGQSILYEQSKLILKTTGSSEAMIKQNNQVQKKCHYT